MAETDEPRVDPPAARLVVAVVATHDPDVPALDRLLDAVVPQVAAVVVVDDGSTPELVVAVQTAAGRVGATAVPQGENRGLGAAQNVGIARALDRGATHVLLLDQDSLPAADMVGRLLDAAAARASVPGARPVAAVGPVATDERNGGAPLLFAATRWGPRRATVPDTPGALVPVAFLFASGCLLDAAALAAVGPIREEWFIDLLDVEWALRARRAGYGLYGVVGARLDHALGDATARVPGRGTVHLHSPQRSYYQVRNTVLLVRSGLAPTAWRWGYLAWFVRHAAFHVLGVPPRALRARLILRGLVDGLRGRTGRLRHIPPAGQAG